jgi:transposase
MMISNQRAIDLWSIPDLVDTSQKRDTAQRRCVMPQRRRFTKQFKEEAIRLVRQEGVSLTQVAQGLGIGANMLRRWWKEVERQGPKTFCGQGVARDEELARLKRELGRIKRERDFLRDAAAYFAKESKCDFNA